MIAILMSKDAPPPSISGKVKIYKDLLLAEVAPQNYVDDTDWQESLAARSWKATYLVQTLRHDRILAEEGSNMKQHRRSGPTIAARVCG